MGFFDNLKQTLSGTHSSDQQVIHEPPIKHDPTVSGQQTTIDTVPTTVQLPPLPDNSGASMNTPSESTAQPSTDSLSLSSDTNSIAVNQNTEQITLDTNNDSTQSVATPPATPPSESSDEDHMLPPSDIAAPLLIEESTDTTTPTVSDPIPDNSQQISTEDNQPILTSDSAVDEQPIIPATEPIQEEPAPNIAEVSTEQTPTDTSATPENNESLNSPVESTESVAEIEPLKSYTVEGHKESTLVNELLSELPDNITLKQAVALTVAVLTDHKEEYEKAKDEGNLRDFFSKLLNTADTNSASEDSVSNTYSPTVS